jgi:hypothetical protein
MKKVLGPILGLVMGATMFAPIFTIGAEGVPISAVQIIASDEINFVDTVFDGVRHRLAVDANISSVNVPFGRDMRPDNYTRVNDTGAEGDTLTLTIKGTNVDPSTPDDDVPDYIKVFTVQAGEVGDEAAFVQRIITELNADVVFRQTVFLKAQRVKDRRIFHIFSTKFSGALEFWERPNAGDYDVVTTGSMDVFEPDTRLVSRSKETSLTADPENPHIVGRQGFTGDVTVTSGAIADLYQENAKNLGSSDLRVDGSVTPVDFTIDCDPDDDIFIEEIRFHTNCNGLKRSTFLCLNQPLTNGIYLEVRSDERVTAWPVFKSTSDFADLFARGTGQNWIYEDVSGTDGMRATLTLNNPFPIRVCGAFGANPDDYILVRVQDDIDSGLVEFAFTGFGFTKEP